MTRGDLSAAGVAEIASVQEQARAEAAEHALREQSVAARLQQKQWSEAVAGIGEGTAKLELELAETQQALAEARHEVMCALPVHTIHA